MPLKQYSPDKVIVLVGGARVRAFADGSMVTVARAEDNRSIHVGTDGKTRHIKSLNDSGTVSLKLADYSPSNAAIQLLNDLDVPFPIAIIDKTSKGDLFTTVDAMVQREPDFEKGKEAADNEWTFQYGAGIKKLGGAIET